MFACNRLFCKWAITLWPFKWWMRMVHTLGVWLMDATYAMSSLLRHNKTLEYGISRTFNITETTMSFCFLFFTYPKSLHYTLYQYWVKTSPTRWKISQSNLHLVNCSLNDMKIHSILLWNDSIVTLVSCFACGMSRLPTHHIVALCIQWSLRYSMNQDPLGYLVAMVSICSCTHKNKIMIHWKSSWIHYWAQNK